MFLNLMKFKLIYVNKCNKNNFSPGIKAYQIFVTDTKNIFQLNIYIY